MTINSSFYSPVRPVMDQEMKSRSLRLVEVDCPLQCSQKSSQKQVVGQLLPLLLHGSVKNTLEMPLSFSLENKHQGMYLLPDLDINIYYLSQGPIDDSAVQPFTTLWFPSFGVSCVERERNQKERSETWPRHSWKSLNHLGKHLRCRTRYQLQGRKCLSMMDQISR